MCKEGGVCVVNSRSGRQVAVCDSLFFLPPPTLLFLPTGLSLSLYLDCSPPFLYNIFLNRSFSKMNNHWQYESFNPTAGIDDEQAWQCSSYWGYPMWSANSLYASIPWLGIGGMALPAHAPSSSSSSTFYPSSSSATLYPSPSATTVSDIQQQLPGGGLYPSVVFENVQPAELKREVETDYNSQSSISSQVDELISALMPLPQNAPSTGAQAGTNTDVDESLERDEVGCLYLFQCLDDDVFSVYSPVCLRPAPV